jgi:hypothetical protein
MSHNLDNYKEVLAAVQTGVDFYLTKEAKRVRAMAALIAIYAIAAVTALALISAVLFFADNAILVFALWALGIIGAGLTVTEAINIRDKTLRDSAESWTMEIYQTLR